MDRTRIINEYMTSYNKIVAKFKKEHISKLVDKINTAISSSNMENVNFIYDEISDWNNLVSNVQGSRDALISYDRTLKLPSIKEFLIIFDNITKEWRFNTEA